MTFETYLKYREDFLKQYDVMKDELVKKYTDPNPYIFFSKIQRCHDFARFIYLFSNDIRNCLYRNVVSSLAEKKYRVGRPNTRIPHTFGDAVKILDFRSLYDRRPEIFDQAQAFYEKKIKV
ncbi:hypothetical protein [uncultured Chryseobacterium sp.]|uniref:hypothetical protein n=1 Tax=uncultured Chryseobacterium sp. TaxID=259322 RepID=UPI0025F8B791|nr:hypothetical protein [uncultured Chryseobacterium sp.]